MSRVFHSLGELALSLYRINWPLRSHEKLRPSYGPCSQGTAKLEDALTVLSASKSTTVSHMTRGVKLLDYRLNYPDSGSHKRQDHSSSKCNRLMLPCQLKGRYEHDADGVL